MRRRVGAENAVWETRLLAVVVATLLVFGIAAIYGASSIVAVEQHEPGWAFAGRQLIGAFAGGVLCVIAARVDYHVGQRFAWPLVGTSALLLLVTVLPWTHGIAPEINGARRWIYLPLVSFQPSEIASLAVGVWTAMLAAKKDDVVREFKRGLLPFMVIVGPLSALVLVEPDLSGAVFLALLAGVVLFTAGARIGHFLLLGLAAVPFAWHEIASVQYRLARVLTFAGHPVSWPKPV